MKNMESNLETLRKKVDKIDQKILQLLHQRLSLAQKIGIYKKKHNLPIIDKKRYHKVLDRRVAWGEKIKLPKQMIRDLFKLIHKFCLQKEKENESSPRTKPGAQARE